MHQEILKFWFEEIEPKCWWTKDPAFDRLITERFLAIHGRAVRCELFEWRRTPEGRLAEIIVLDQFSRNIYRDSPLAFASDPLALALAQEVVSRGADRALSAIRRNFLYMPYMHSESLPIHDVALELFRQNGIESSLDYEMRHRAIIARFGRYPHRNEVLGRPSTTEEIAFLREPGSSF